ncbi:MotA/TolQ/ExbB proton channel family protein [Fusibacter ferrireducens]|uniref:Uncharacterized protein n=1 Tax=Fusibacter ferrireducens TaxID=2785058 RepID=A0ABR9ZU37_9FIRM|nr:hypothetical protein [Fusibacter ferrireducens]MBF4693962.1 hypothetical protein [Fusibacter ferrireducens]
MKQFLKWLSNLGRQNKTDDIKDEMNQITMEKKRTLLPLIQNFMVLTESARYQGLLELENFTRSPEMPMLLRKGLKLGINGIPTKDVVRQLKEMAKADKGTSYEQLEQILIIEGIESILEGTPPEVLRERLGAYLGSSLYNDLLTLECPEELTAYGYTCDKNLKQPKTEFEFEINNLNIYMIWDDEMFAQFLENMFDDPIAVLIAVADAPLKKKILDCLPLERRAVLKSASGNYNPYLKQVQQAADALSQAMNEWPPVQTIKYEVYVDDNYENFSCDGGSGQAQVGTYDSLEEAVETCKSIIDKSLKEGLKPGVSAESLMNSWKFGGPTAFIRGNSIFNSDEYVKRCAKEISEGQKVR